MELRQHSYFNYQDISPYNSNMFGYPLNSKKMLLQFPKMTHQIKT